MSHDTHHGHSTENKNIISFKNAFWLVVIIAGLFVAALNFVQAESGGEKREGGEAKETTGLNTAETQKENHSQVKPEEHPNAETSKAAEDTAAKMAK